MEGKPLEKDTYPNQHGRSKLKRGLFAAVGTIFLGLGAVGVFLPILPTTPFLLLSTACYYKSSNRMHQWMLNNRWFGNYIRNYKEGRGIPFKTKIFTATLLWTVITYSALFHVGSILIIQTTLFIIAAAVTIHIARLPTLKKPS